MIGLLLQRVGIGAAVRIATEVVPPDTPGGEQGIGPDFIEPGSLYSQPPGNAVDFTEEG